MGGGASANAKDQEVSEIIGTIFEFSDANSDNSLDQHELKALAAAIVHVTGQDVQTVLADIQKKSGTSGKVNKDELKKYFAGVKISSDQANQIKDEVKARVHKNQGVVEAGAQAEAQAKAEGLSQEETDKKVNAAKDSALLEITKQDVEEQKKVVEAKRQEHEANPSPTTEQDLQKSQSQLVVEEHFKAVLEKPPDAPTEAAPEKPPEVPPAAPTEGEVEKPPETPPPAPATEQPPQAPEE